MASAPESPPSSRLLLWGPVVAYMAVIFAVSAMSSPPAPPGVSDKLEHFACYGGLALLTVRALAGGRMGGVTPAVLALAWGITSVYGVSDEYHQSFVPQRSPEAADVLADATGAAVAVAAVGASGILRRSRQVAGGR